MSRISAINPQILGSKFKRTLNKALLAPTIALAPLMHSCESAATKFQGQSDGAYYMIMANEASEGAQTVQASIEPARAAISRSFKAVKDLYVDRVNYIRNDLSESGFHINNLGIVDEGKLPANTPLIPQNVVVKNAVDSIAYLKAVFVEHLKAIQTMAPKKFQKYAASFGVEPRRGVDVKIEGSKTPISKSVKASGYVNDVDVNYEESSLLGFGDIVGRITSSANKEKKPVLSYDDVYSLTNKIVKGESFSEEACRFIPAQKDPVIVEIEGFGGTTENLDLMLFNDSDFYLKKGRHPGTQYMSGKSTMP